MLRGPGSGGAGAVLRVAVFLLLFLFSPLVAAESVSDLIGEPVEGVRGERLGHVHEFLLDVEAGRLLYLVVSGPAGYRTFPMQAIRDFSPRNRVTVDVRASGDPARFRPGPDARFRRAGKLIGQRLKEEDGRLPRGGVLHDLEFEPATGAVTGVVIASGEGKRTYPPRVLSSLTFPADSQWP